MSSALLIKTLMASTHCSHRIAKRAADDILIAFCATLQRSRKLAFSNFGSFRVVPLKRRTAMNPLTGEKIAVAASATVRFRPSDFLRKMVATRSKAVKMSPVITHTKPSSQIESSAGQLIRSSADDELTLASRQLSPEPKRKMKATPQNAVTTLATSMKKPASDRRNINVSAPTRSKKKDR